MAGCAVTVLAEVRDRKRSVPLSNVPHSVGAAVIRVDFPRRAAEPSRALPQLVRNAAADHSNVLAVEFGAHKVTFGEIANSMDSIAGALGGLAVDADSALTMALMTEIPALCAFGADGLADALGQLRGNAELVS